MYSVNSRDGSDGLINQTSILKSFNSPVAHTILLCFLFHLRAMSSPGCCHLPGSLCDYSGGSEADSSKDSMEHSDSTSQAQYVAKVTAKDGRPLSTIVKAVSLQR